MSVRDVERAYGVSRYHHATVVDHLGTAMAEGALRGLRWAEPATRALDVWFRGEQLHVDLLITYSVVGPIHTELIEKRAASPWQSMGPHHDGFWAEALEPSVRAMQQDGWLLEAHGLGRNGAMERFAYLLPPTAGGRIELVDAARRGELDAWLGIDRPMTVVRRHLDAVSSGGVAAMAADYAADAVLVRERAYDGLLEIAGYFATVGDRLAGGTVDFEEVVHADAPDTVVVRWRIVGGPGDGTSGTDTLVVDGDRIVHHVVRLDGDDF